MKINPSTDGAWPMKILLGRAGSISMPRNLGRWLPVFISSSVSLTIAALAAPSALRTAFSARSATSSARSVACSARSTTFTAWDCASSTRRTTCNTSAFTSVPQLIKALSAAPSQETCSESPFPTSQRCVCTAFSPLCSDSLSSSSEIPVQTSRRCFFHEFFILALEPLSFHAVFDLPKENKPPSRNLQNRLSR